MTLDLLTAIPNSLMHEPHAGLLNGILFGVKATLSKDLYNSLITTGTLHIVALSGMNISIIVGFVNLFLLRFLRRPIANVATSLIIIGFICLVGTSPSVIRAAIMAGIALLGVSFGRQTWPLLAWILAVTIMLVLNPLWIGDVSFQLSVMATLGIILFDSELRSNEIISNRTAGRYVFSSTVTRNHVEAAGPVGRFPPRTPTRGPLLEGPPTPVTRKDSSLLDGRAEKIIPTSAVEWLYHIIQDDLRVTLAAQVFTIPIIMFQFQRISLVSPLTNILIGWLIAPITIMGFVMVVLGLVWLPLGQIFAWVLWVPLTAIIQAIRLTAMIPFASMGW